jgi:hypothetical protein
MDKKQVVGIDRFLFDDEAEFRRYHLGADIKDWRDPKIKVGDWLLTDDGGVTQCLNKHYLKDGNKKNTERIAITTICGKVRQDISTHKLHNVIYANHTRFIPKDGIVKSNDERKLRKKDEAMARLIMLGEDKYEAFKKTNPNAKCEVYIKQTVSRITNSKTFEDFMSDEFTKLLVDQEMTKKWSLGILKGIAEDAKAPAGVRKEIADDIIEDLGEQRKGQKQIETTTWHKTAEHRIGEGELADVKKIGEKKTEQKEKQVKE